MPYLPRRAESAWLPWRRVLVTEPTLITTRLVSYALVCTSELVQSISTVLPVLVSVATRLNDCWLSFVTSVEARPSLPMNPALLSFKPQSEFSFADLL